MGKPGGSPTVRQEGGSWGTWFPPTGASRGRATSSCLPVGALGAGEQLERMGERGPEHGEAVATIRPVNREVDHQRVAGNPGDTAREQWAWGVFAIESARIASAIPGASRSSTERVASGVTSRGATPCRLS